MNMSQTLAQQKSTDAVRMRTLRGKRAAAQTCNQCEDPPEPGSKTCPEHKFKDRQRQKSRRLRLARSARGS